jgi:hypothetical protein
MYWDLLLLVTAVIRRLHVLNMMRQPCDPENMELVVIKCCITVVAFLLSVS